MTVTTRTNCFWSAARIRSSCRQSNFVKNINSKVYIILHYMNLCEELYYGFKRDAKTDFEQKAKNVNFRDWHAVGTYLPTSHHVGHNQRFPLNNPVSVRIIILLSYVLDNKCFKCTRRSGFWRAKIGFVTNLRPGCHESDERDQKP